MFNYNGKIYQISDWIIKLIYVNVLWIAFTVIGLFVFGFFPATAAMFAVIRKWIVQEEKDIPVFQTFILHYKKDFLQANLIGMIVMALGFFLYFDLRFFQSSSQPFLNMLSFFIYTLFFIFFIFSLYLFPIFVHYELKTMEYLKYSIILAIARPVQTFLMIAAFIIVSIVFYYVPGLGFFLYGSVLSLILTKLASISFLKLSYNRHVIDNNERT